MESSVLKQSVALIGWLALCFAASAIGAFASIQAASFYAELIRPEWAPPAWLFGPVWTTLYAMMAISAWLVWRQGGFKEQPRALWLFLFQLALNALWSWVFFAWQLGMWSFVTILLLWVFIVLTSVSFSRIKKTAGILLIPYLLWVSFAACLNFKVWQLNPNLLG